MEFLDIEMPFGASNRFTCSVPRDLVLSYHQAPAVVDRFEDRVRECLESPLEFPPLAQAVLPDDRIAIALDSETPGVPTLIRGCWDVFAQRGVNPASVTIVESRSPSGHFGIDPRGELPSDVAEQVRLVRYDATESCERAYLASTTTGERIYLSRELTDADFVCCVGPVMYDPLLGYRGTSSVLYPGLSTSEAVHKARGQGHDELGPGDDRGLRQTIDEVGWLLGVQFALQVIPAGGNQVAEVIAGIGDAVFQRGKQSLADKWAIELDERADTVVLTIGGESEGACWSSLGAALETARRLVMREGRILVFSELSGELSPGLEMIRDSRTPRDALKPLRLDGPSDIVSATQIAKALDWANVSLVSQLEDETVEDLFMIPLSLSDNFEKWMESSESVAFIESAEYAFGRITVPV